MAELKGRRPAGLDDFLGVTSFAVMKGDLTYRVFGTGHPGSGTVRFTNRTSVGTVGTSAPGPLPPTPHRIAAEPDDDARTLTGQAVTALAEIKGWVRGARPHADGQHAGCMIGSDTRVAERAHRLKRWALDPRVELVSPVPVGYCVR